MQMLLIAMLVNALHAALEDAKIALKGVHMDFAAGVLFAPMIYSLMTGKFATKIHVIFGLVGHKAAFLGQVRVKDRLDGFAVRFFDMKGPNLATALDQA